MLTAKAVVANRKRSLFITRSSRGNDSLRATFDCSLNKVKAGRLRATVCVGKTNSKKEDCGSELVKANEGCDSLLLAGLMRKSSEPLLTQVWLKFE